MPLSNLENRRIWLRYLLLARALPLAIVGIARRIHIGDLYINFDEPRGAFTGIFLADSFYALDFSVVPRDIDRTVVLGKRVLVHPAVYYWTIQPKQIGWRLFVLRPEWRPVLIRDHGPMLGCRFSQPAGHPCGRGGL